MRVMPMGTYTLVVFKELMADSDRKAAVKAILGEVGGAI